MKNRILLMLLAILIILGCNLNNPSGEMADLTSVDLAGADGYLRVWNSPAKLNAVKSGETAEVTWTDELGQAVSVPVSESKLLGADYMAMQYTYNETTTTAIADIATGDLVEIAAPSNWGEIEYRDGQMYYIGNGAIRRIDPAVGTNHILSSDDEVPGGATLTLGDSLVPFALSGTFKKSYPAAGPRDLSGSPSAIRMYDGLSVSGSVKSHSLIYDSATDTHYMIHWTGDEYWEQQLGDDGSITDGAAVTLADNPFSGARRVGSGEARPDNSVFTDGYAVRTVSITGGVITLNDAYTETNSGTSVAESKYVDGMYYYQSNTIDNMVYQVRESNLIDTDRVLVEVGIYDLEDWDIVAGQLFWIDDAGSWVMDLDTGDVSEYQASAVEAVTE
jgi:hypothetical protein